jgi:hypothetical protein
MPRPPVGGEGIETRRYMLRLPAWMLQYLLDEAIRQETDVSKLVRLAIRRTFFSDSNGSNLHTTVHQTHERQAKR